MNYQKGFANIALIVLVLVVTGIIGYFAFVQKSPAVIQQTNPPSDTQQNKQTPPMPVNETADWKTFASKTEGFIIKYPTNWAVEDSSNTNCGHNKLNGSDCRDRYDFVSPDGVRVRYVIHANENNDQFSCGTQADCASDTVFDLEKLSVKNFGEVYVVKLEKKVSLHKPLSQETTPIVGENEHSNFSIDFSLPSKTGGRYNLFITTSFAGYEPPKLQNIAVEQFYNLESVKQGILILKSLSY